MRKGERAGFEQGVSANGAEAGAKGTKKKTTMRRAARKRGGGEARPSHTQSGTGVHPGGARGEDEQVRVTSKEEQDTRGDSAKKEDGDRARNMRRRKRAELTLETARKGPMKRAGWDKGHAERTENGVNSRMDPGD